MAMTNEQREYLRGLIAQKISDLESRKTEALERISAKFRAIKNTKDDLKLKEQELLRKQSLIYEKAMNELTELQQQIST